MAEPQPSKLVMPVRSRSPAPTIYGRRVTNPADLLELMPFAKSVGVELDTVAPEHVTGRLPWAADRCMLGGCNAAFMTIDRLSRIGRIHGERTRVAFERRLRRFLARTGYV